ncbi:hypothetical protein LA080_014379 [Diaporthe eres]|uniref:Uncharacterized protein n=1 Tax=Diaporthe vaccinii TaxID=105482 RepID=A0ABR4E5F1_9PEZI|nr:hypothetical protein LA080_014379 [Diaporthe eres]
MKLLVYLAVLIAAVISMANPVEKRAAGSVEICTGPEATGNCSTDSYELDICHNVTSEFSGNAGTFAPVDDGFYCFLYLTACGSKCTSPTGCPGGLITYDSPEKFNLAALAPGWDRLFTSFECHAGANPS